MTSATLLRKTLLAQFQKRIIPTLRENGAQRLMSAQMPLRTPPGFSLREMPYPPLSDADARNAYPEGKNWDDVYMHAINLPSLYCVVEGEADILVGVTAAQFSQLSPAQKPAEARGGYMVSVPTSGFLLFPPKIPKRTGALPPWSRDEPHTGTLQMVNLRALPIGVLCHLSTLKNGVFNVGYSLLVRDTHLINIFALLVDEMSTPAPNAEILSGQMQTLMLRLERGLETQRPFMTDGLYSRFPESDPTNSQSQLVDHPIIARAHKFIQLRLHEPLTPAVIAEHVRITPTQLNRIFKANAGQTTMNYVTKLRLEAAQLLLSSSDLSVQEICQLVGFRRSQHFSSTFRQFTGTSPLKFRQQHSGFAL